MSRETKPWLPLYVDDFLGDETVKVASNRTLGAYVKLLCHQWTHKSVPVNPDELAAIVHEPRKDWDKMWPRLCEKFPEKNGRLVNPRLERERRQADKVLRAKRKGARTANRVRAESTPESVDYAGVQTQPQTQTQESKDWVRALGREWRDTYGGEPAYGQIGRACKKLVAEHGLETVTQRWVNYLRATEARYASPSRFAQTYGSWGEAGGQSATDVWVSPDAARVEFRRVGIPEQWPVNPEGYKTKAELELAIAARLLKLHVEVA